MINNFLQYIDIKKNILIKKISSHLKQYVEDEEGVGVIEVVLILVVLIGLVLVFKDKISQLLNNVFTKINQSANELYN